MDLAECGTKHGQIYGNKIDQVDLGLNNIFCVLGMCLHTRWTLGSTVCS